MSIITNNRAARCFKFTIFDKVVKMNYQNLTNYDNEGLAMVEITVFGLNHVYTLIDLSKVSKFMKLVERRCELTVGISRIVGDSPAFEDINTKSSKTYYESLSSENWISIYQLNNLFAGMNIVSDMDLSNDIQYYLDIDDKESFIDFGANIDCECIVLYDNGDYRKCNTIIDFRENFKGVFVYISEFNCWQYLSRKKYLNLINIEGVEIRDAITDKPVCYSEVQYTNEYYIDNPIKLLKIGIFVPVNLYIGNIFDRNNMQIRMEESDAINIHIFRAGEDVDILLTYHELGIRYNEYGTLTDMSNKKGIVPMKHFSIIDLINNLICIKP